MLASKCSFLIGLNLSGCYQIDDDGLILLTTELLYLEHLCISGCAKVTDRGLGALYESSRVLLKYSAVDHSIPIPTKSGLAAMPDKQKRFGLQRVSYHQMSDHSSRLVLYFPNKPKALHRWMDESLPDKYKPLLISDENTFRGQFYSMHLSCLNVLHCHQLSTTWHAKLRELHPNVHIIH